MHKPRAKSTANAADMGCRIEFADGGLSPTRPLCQPLYAFRPGFVVEDGVCRQRLSLKADIPATMASASASGAPASFSNETAVESDVSEAASSATPTHAR
jgi:hypothetical protein